jgi:CheY-like chemotaxis protein
MKILKCLIVDDEPPAIRLLESMLVKFLLELIDHTSSLEALAN